MDQDPMDSLENPFKASWSHRLAFLGDDPGSNAGSFENVPHAPVHRWTGDPTQTNGEDMGIFYSAARDPIFYCHHANVDRAWTIWKTLGGKRKDYNDPDWLNASFAFYDENAQLVHVKVADCGDQTRLGYAYQAVDIPWLKSKPVPGKKKSKVATTFARANNATVVFPITLNKIVQVVIKRPKKSRSKRQKEEEEEVLCLEGIMLDRAKYIKFDVYINDEDSKGSAPDKTELVGSFVNLPHQHSHKSMFKRSQKFTTDGKPCSPKTSRYGMFLGRNASHGIQSRRDPRDHQQ
ncbi:hypothetical protein RJ640_017093 [Escallonia rubra]|uniref:Tyrosinase copper-binding domain-containing protein n=1 Tax=Escallonia rubra TaxID=112253 RepID=A0AA88U0R7_9ASTE|nr:hypothetical protein RJ640_017093 [Escallonia rubra]